MPFKIPASIQSWVRPVSVILAALVFVAFVVAPTARWLSHRYATIRDARARITQTQAFQSSGPGREQTLAETRRQVEGLQLQVSRGQGIARVLDRLRADAQRWHVEMSAAQSAEEATPRVVQWGPHLSLQVTPITLTLIGRYSAIGEFVGGLARAPFVAEVDQIALQRHPERYPQLEATLTLLVYGTETSLTAPPVPRP